MTTLQQKIQEIQTEFETSNIASTMYDKIRQAYLLFEVLNLGSVEDACCSLTVNIKVLDPKNIVKGEAKPFRKVLTGRYLSSSVDQLEMSFSAHETHLLSCEVEEQTPCYFSFELNGTIYGSDGGWADELFMEETLEHPSSYEFKDLVDFLNSQDLLSLFVRMTGHLNSSAFDNLPKSKELKEIVASYNKRTEQFSKYDQIKWLDEYDALWDEYLVKSNTEISKEELNDYQSVMMANILKSAKYK